MKERVSAHKCNWYKGPVLLDLLDSLELPPRNEKGPLRIPVLDRYKEQSVYVLGKIESGTIRVGQKYIVMPHKTPIDVTWLFNTEENGVPYAKPGESVRVINIILFRLKLEVRMKMIFKEEILYVLWMIYALLLILSKQKFLF